MNKKKPVIIAAAAVCAVTALFFVPGYLKPVSVKVDVSPRKIHIGDPVRYSVLVRSGRNIEIDFPDMEENLKGFSIKARDVSETVSFGKRTTKREYMITSYSVGEHIIPGLSLGFKYAAGEDRKGSVSTRDLRLEVVSLLPKDVEYKAGKIRTGGGLAGPDSGITGMDEGGVTETDAPIRFRIKEVREPRDIFEPLNLLRKVLVIAGITVFTAVSTWLFFALRGRRRMKALTPAELALKRIEFIRGKKYGEKDMYKELAAKLSFTVMDYVKARYGLPGKPMMADEFLGETMKIGGLAEDKKEYLSVFIRMCDLVKYAAEKPEGAEEALDPDAAARFVEETSGTEAKE